MRIKLNVTRHTTVSELVVLGAFFESLALAREGHVSSVSVDEPLTAPIDPAELGEPETVVVQPAPAAGEEAPKRKRRSKAEIEADAEAARIAAAEAARIAAAEAEAQTANEAALACAKAEVVEEPPKESPVQEPGNDQPVPTQPAQETKSGVAETPATASPSEPPTHATLNLKATAVAKKIGPEKIKAKINELGGKLISTLSPEALIEFDQWLDAQ